jgi:hypothetical protein
MNKKTEIQKMTEDELLNHNQILASEQNSLQENINFLEIKIKKERMIWLLSLIIIFDIFCFQHMNVWSTPIIIGLFEFILILFVAHHWGLQQILAIWNDIVTTLKNRS